MTHTTGYPYGIFATRDEAEAAALEAAQGEIDAEGSVGGPINASPLLQYVPERDAAALSTHGTILIGRLSTASFLSI